MPFPCLFTPIFSLYKCFMQNPVSTLMHIVCLFGALLLNKLLNLAPTTQSESRMCRCILRDDGSTRKKTQISGLNKRNAAEFFKPTSWCHSLKEKRHSHHSLGLKYSITFISIAPHMPNIGIPILAVRRMFVL